MRLAEGGRRCFLLAGAFLKLVCLLCMRGGERVGLFLSAKKGVVWSEVLCFRKRSRFVLFFFFFALRDDEHRKISQAYKTDPLRPRACILAGCDALCVGDVGVE